MVRQLLNFLLSFLILSYSSCDLSFLSSKLFAAEMPWEAGGLPSMTASAAPNEGREI